MSNLGTTTYSGMVKRGLDFKNGNQLWVAIDRGHRGQWAEADGGPAMTVYAPTDWYPPMPGV